MIDINIRRTSIYMEAEITFGGTVFCSGLLDEKEATEMAKAFISAAEDLLPVTYGEAVAELGDIREGLET